MDKIGGIINNKRFNKLSSKLDSFTMVSNRFLESIDFTIHEKMVVIVIKKHLMNRHTAWPSLRKIANQSGCSVSTVKRTVSKLQERNILIKSRPNRRKNNNYKLSLKEME